MKQASLGVLLIVAALFTGCAEDAVVEQQRWHVNIKADRQGDDALTRSLYLDGTALKAKWTGTEVLKVYNSSDEEVGTLTASANLTGGSTTLTGDLTANVSIGDKLYIWSPSNTPDYTVQDGTVAGANGISAKDYIKAEIEVEAKDDANHILNTTNATFEHQQSFTKFSVTPAVHSLKISATGMSDITATLDGTTEDNDFYVALPNTGGSAKTFTLTGTTYAGVAFTDSKSKQLEDGKYYVASMDLKTTPIVTAPTAKNAWSTDGTAHDLINAGSTSGGTLYYYMSTANSTPTAGVGGWITTVPQATAAGTYYVWYYVSGNANYRSTEVVGPLSVRVVPTGALPGVFSVAANKKVYFSQGNLQYQASTCTWRFAEHQWDYVGDGGTTCGNVTESDNTQISSTYSGWIDLFGWGTSGWNNGNALYQPYSSTINNSIYSESNGYGYGPTSGGTYTYSLTDSYANADWGVYNAISNGGNSAGLWCTLTKDEWLYLFGMTSNNSDASGHARYRKYFRATVNSVQGIVVLPDDISGISDIPAESSRGTASTFDGKTYTTAAWSALESAGAVFLPAAGIRNGTMVDYAGSFGLYWSTTANGTGYAYCVFFYSSFNSDDVDPATAMGRLGGLSVRLVRVAP